MCMTRDCSASYTLESSVYKITCNIISALMLPVILYTELSVNSSSRWLKSPWAATLEPYIHFDDEISISSTSVTCHTSKVRKKKFLSSAVCWIRFKRKMLSRYELSLLNLLLSFFFMHNICDFGRLTNIYNFLFFKQNVNNYIHTLSARTYWLCLILSYFVFQISFICRDVNDTFIKYIV